MAKLVQTEFILISSLSGPVCKGYVVVQTLRKMNVVNGFGNDVLVKTAGEDEKKMKKVVDEARLS